MLGYLSLNIICSPNLAVFLDLSFAHRSQPCIFFSFFSIVDRRLREAVNSLGNSLLLETDNVQRRISYENIFALINIGDVSFTVFIYISSLTLYAS